ncbi:hypothetical protein AB0M43_06075 [Longispora sp. NPDC051575]|uniref:hypothetical protein n=1 Tax=Longispora sp. NPDC051575 TaxID=3154943 RepID=UPI003424F08E
MSPAFPARLFRTALAAVALALVFTAAPASAAPATSTGDDGVAKASVTLDNTTPGPGEVVSFTFQSTFNQPVSYAADAVIASTELSPYLTLESCPGATSCSFDAFAMYAVVSGAGTATIRVRVAPGTPLGTTFTFTPAVQYYTSAGHELLLTPTITLTVRPSAADVGVRLAATSAGLLTNRIDYTATVGNAGPQPLAEGKLVTTLSTVATSVSSPDGCSLDAGRRSVSCPLGALPVSGSANRRFSVTYPTLTVGLTLNATAVRAFSSPGDPNPANDSAVARCVVVTPLLILC